MNTILIMMKNILRQLFRKKGNLLIYLFLPIVGLLIPLMTFSSGDGSAAIKVGIVNHDGGFVSQKLSEDIRLQKRFQVSDADEGRLKDDLAGGSLDCALIIPEGYTDSFLKGDVKTIQVVSVQGIAATAWVDNYLALFMRNMEILADSANGDLAAFQGMYQTFRVSATTVEVQNVKNFVTNYNITYLGLGFLIQFLLIGAGRTAALIIKEREEKTLARIRCAPVKGYQFMTSNVVINVCLLLVQTLIALAALQYLFKVDIGVSLLDMMLIMSPLMIAAVGMSLMIASFAKNERHLGTLMTIFIYPTCLISGCFWDVDMMPEFMRKIAQLMPQRWALDGVEALMMGKNVADLALNLVVLFAFAAAFFAIAVFGFSRKQATAA